MTEQQAKDWLKKQAIWQIYLPAPRKIPRPKSDVGIPNELHQADLLFLPHDRLPRGKNLYKYALTVVDVTSRYKAAEPLASKESSEVAAALTKVYQRGPMKWPKVLQVGPVREFMGAVSQLLSKHSVNVRRGAAGAEGAHQGQSIVERLNRTLTKRLFGHQYAQEMRFLGTAKEGQRSTEWVQRHPAVVAALNRGVTRLTGRKPVDATKLKKYGTKALLCYAFGI